MHVSVVSDFMRNRLEIDTIRPTLEMLARVSTVPASFLHAGSLSAMRVPCPLLTRGITFYA